MNRTTTLAVAALACLAIDRDAEAGGKFFRGRGRAVTPTAAVANPANADAPSPMLGTFYPTPYTIVAADFPTGNGYAPLGQYGMNNMVMYGPTSIYRAITAPVSIYSRGYDGSVREERAFSASTPFRPGLSPVIYPLPNSYYYAPRSGLMKPTFMTGNHWVDQN